MTTSPPARRTGRSKAERGVRRRRTASWRWGEVVLLSLLLLAAATPWGGVFSGTIGYRAAWAGVLVGICVALVATRMRLGIAGSFVVAVLGHLLAGGIACLPGTTTQTILPTVETIRLLTIGVVTGWKDLLTVKAPVLEAGSVTVVPFLAGEVAAFIAVSIATRRRRTTVAVLPPLALGLAGILWGSQHAPFALPIGVAVAVLALVWAVLAVARARKGLGASDLRIGESVRRVDTAGILGLVVLLALSGGAAWAVHQVTPSGLHRTVLRDHFEPPLDLREYTSPAVHFRSWHTDGVDKTLLRVADLPQGARVRLATLDAYDGTVFQIEGSAPANTFLHVGQRFTDDPLPEGESPTRLGVEVVDYTGSWVPAGARTRTLEYTSARRQQLAEALYTASGNSSVLSAIPLVKGDAYTVGAVLDRAVPDSVLADHTVTALQMPADSNVPDAVRTRAAELTQGAAAGFEQVRMLQRQLHTQGFYSDGTDGLSRPGHRADRLQHFLESDNMVGDDDQYVPAMALMLRSLGIPSRVVIGFLPPTGAAGTVELTGDDVHMWVEVPFDGIGWVPFDPTPPKDQTLRSQVPEPKPRPRPEVLQPPEPPEDPAEAPTEEVDESEDDKDDSTTDQRWPLIVAMASVGGILLLLSPLLLLIALRAMRMRRRRVKGSPEIRSLSAWDELLDRSRELGITVPAGVTRAAQALVIDRAAFGQESGQATAFRTADAQRRHAAVLADTIDAAVFGPEEVDETTSRTVWGQVDDLVRAVRSAAGRRRRFKALFSLRGLHRRWVRAEPLLAKVGVDRRTGAYGTVKTGDDTEGGATELTEEVHHG
ncbi:hypothetical protein I6B53_08640 [Schaalia sp. 19OD2882]|uniref:transglutaminase family protein n=1 Tax=Schaalia sp. 19OD2882 TaxID=2794089 RepID=UPI001C1EAF7B|nr:transglutaminase domain-containing protein [Schaalia sp. 19OD2882]QWW19163.1 hypothetical protein I6B53_08640 [Schaalia sp. 19OD2882]